MDAVVVRQFLNFFQDFIDLCQWKDWPKNDTTEEEIRNAFLISCHIEKCLDKFQSNGTFNDVLEILNTAQDSVDACLKACLMEPSKYILKKIIISTCKISLMDVALKAFVQQFSEQKLENYLTDLIVESSSKQMLLKFLPIEISKDKILRFKSEVLLSQITPESKETLQDMLTNYNKDSIDLIVVSLCASEPKYQNSVDIIAQCVLDVLLSKNNKYKHFWKLLFNVNNDYLIKMCVENSDLYTYMCEALIDCGKLLKENMSAEYFYIDFSYSEVVSITNKLFTNEFLKTQFLEILNDHGSDIDFWQNIF